MSEIKGAAFDAMLQRSLGDRRVFLIYGPDRGLVSERARNLAKATGVALDDPFAVIRLDAQALQHDPGRFLDEVNAFGLFGGDRLVWVRGTGNEKALTDGIVALEAEPPTGTYVILEAGDLKKTAGLRRTAETSRSMTAVSCYMDDPRAIAELLDTELSSAGMRIAPEARTRLMESLGGDRLASRNEIQKLVLYCNGNDMIAEQDVLDIVGDASALSVDDAVDCVLQGDVEGLNRAVQRIVLSKTAIFLVLQGCLKQFQLMDVMRSEVDIKRLQASDAIQTFGRHLHFRRKPLIENALRHWTLSAIRRETNRLNAAILQSRARSSLEDSIALQTLLSTTLQSARQNR